MHRMNARSLENLVSLADLPPEDRREIARMGGIASGRRRRHLAQLRKAAFLYAEIKADQADREEREAQRRRQRKRKKKPRRPSTPEPAERPTTTENYSFEK